MRPPCIDCFCERRPNDIHRRCNSCHHKWRKLWEPGFAQKQAARDAAYKARNPERWKAIHAKSEHDYRQRRLAVKRQVEVNCSRCGLLDLDVVCRYCRMELAGVGFMDWNAFA